MQAIKYFTIHKLKKKKVLTSSDMYVLSKYRKYVDILIVFGLCNKFFIFSYILLKIYRSKVFYFLSRKNMSARKIKCTSDILDSWVRSIGIERLICPHLLKDHNFEVSNCILFSRGYVHAIYTTNQITLEMYVYQTRTICAISTTKPELCLLNFSIWYIVKCEQGRGLTKWKTLFRYSVYAICNIPIFSKLG